LHRIAARWISSAQYGQNLMADPRDDMTGRTVL
jgi:hypothetical protein